MAHTALAFYRKSQNLDSLNLERPKSIETVRNAVRSATDDLLHTLTFLERSYYEGMGCDGYISTSYKAILPVMKEMEVSYIHAAYQVPEIHENLKLTNKHGEFIYNVDTEALENLNRIKQKVLDYLPSKFQNYIDSVKHIVETIEKYCLSFHTGDSDLYMESAYHYEAKAKEFKEAIQIHIGNIKDMGESYRFKKGLGVRHFGLYVNEIARRNDVGLLPFLLAIPQACENIRNCCRAIIKWIETDDQYALFISHDIADLEKKKESEKVKIKTLHEELYLVEHKIKTSKHNMELLKDEISKLRPKEVKLTEELTMAEKNLKFLEMDLNNLKKQQVEIRKSASSELTEYSQIAEEILLLQLEKIPAAKAQVEHAEHRIKWLVEKRENNDTLKKEYRSSKQRMIELNTLISKHSEELNRINKYLKELKRILANKTSQESMKKIFHEMPVQIRNRKPRNQTMKGNYRQDNLERAIEITANVIHQDWVQLYRYLPFHPHRGREIIDKDIDDIITREYRSRSKEQAKDSLERWVRLHTRASLADLKRALIAIKRPDIVDLFTIKSQNKRKKTQKVLAILPTKHFPSKRSKISHGNKFKSISNPKRKGTTVYMETKSSFMPLTLPSI